MELRADATNDQIIHSVPIKHLEDSRAVERRTVGHECAYSADDAVFGLQLYKDRDDRFRARIRTLMVVVVITCRR